MICTKCKEEKEDKEYYPSVSSLHRNGFAYWCKQCFRAYHVDNRQHRLAYQEKYNKDHPEQKREWTEANKENIRAYKRARYQRKKEEILHAARLRRDRIRGSVGQYSLEEWEALKEASNYQCVACGATENLTRDHIVPIIKGGSNSIENIAVLCVSCNSSKKDQGAEWYDKSISYST